MIFQKNNLRSILLIIFGILIIVIFFYSYDSSCGVKHISILNQIQIYDETLDPEFCEVILDKIDSFNDGCSPTFEILDCG
ncbi:MAG: hypothetical protein NZ747_06075 [Nitrosopumilus sp.]|nr:hypothetical protein [Nitrosopumilus sp.]